MIPLIANNLEEIIRIAKTHHVKGLWLFGSAAGQGIDGNTFGPDSDVDFLVEFDPEIYDIERYNSFDIYMDLCDALKELLGRNVDLVSTRARNSERFKRNVEQQKLFIYAA
ncbi:nucleotidyltransferase domain-containing protein [Parabacteroides sp. PF5-6]|uniref:nucleotidyltransferase family protein n=1 Tax=Parabacteroides sp. PF5-6 TaxID=1742403 RepID=UPI0024070533|nr:nucleotidyltransferase domain-containing protein [Parabacteroides sp. PF5-6]MDF9829640.1 putative nucleotidyltransferase [Parabacteroides sp. PF5-6]